MFCDVPAPLSGFTIAIIGTDGYVEWTDKVVYHVESVGEVYSGMMIPVWTGVMVSVMVSVVISVMASVLCTANREMIKRNNIGEIWRRFLCTICIEHGDYKGVLGQFSYFLEIRFLFEIVIEEPFLGFEWKVDVFDSGYFVCFI